MPSGDLPDRGVQAATEPQLGAIYDETATPGPGFLFKLGRPNGVFADPQIDEDPDVLAIATRVAGPDPALAD